MSKYNVTEKALEAREKTWLYFEGIVTSLFLIIGLSLFHIGDFEVKSWYCILGVFCLGIGLILLFKFLNDTKGDEE